jgi:hypothetical protein
MRANSFGFCTILSCSAASLGRQVALDLLHLVVVHRRGVDVVDGGGAGERLARLLHRDDGVLESRRLRVGRDLVDFFQLLRHPLFDGGLDVLHLELAERRHAALRPLPGREKHVLLVVGHGALRLIGLSGRVGLLLLGGTSEEHDGERRQSASHGSLMVSRT